MAAARNDCLCWPTTTGELVRRLGTTEARVADAIRRGCIDAPPVRAGRRLWWPSHARALAEYLGVLTPALAAEIDAARLEGGT
jgi:hypothetical protein